jgi:hypothetical protein
LLSLNDRIREKEQEEEYKPRRLGNLLYWWGPYPDLKIGFATFSVAADLTEASLANIVCLGYEPPPPQSSY